MTVRRLRLAISSILLAAAWTASPIATAPAAAQTSQSAPAAQRNATLLVHGHPILTLKTPNGKLQPEDRVRLATQRLNDFLGKGGKTVSAQHTKSGAWIVQAGDATLVVVTDREADAHGGEPEGLARLWAKKIDALLTGSALVLPAGPVVVPLGETKTIPIGGYAPAADMTVQDGSETITKSLLNAADRTISVQGVSPGQSDVLVTSGGESRTLHVFVRRYAARIAPEMAVTITGDPAAPIQTVAQALYHGVLRAISLDPQATVALETSPAVTAPLDSGDSMAQRIFVTATGPELIPVRQAVAVTIVNRALPQQEPSALLYSNDPERVSAPGELFRGRLRDGQSVRLDYHHQNISGGDLAFHAELWNESDEPASALVISGMSLPARDTFQVGRRAGAAFLRALSAGAGIVIDVPPHARVPLIAQRLPDGLTVSGIVQMQQLSGPATGLTLRVAADNDNSVLASPAAQMVQTALGSNALLSPVMDQPDTATGDTAKLSAHVYNAPRITVQGSYTVGGKWEHVKIGHTDPLKDASGTLSLLGNYGATYTVSLSLNNPTDKPRTVAVFFDPSAGYAAGVFRLPDGSVIDFDPIQTPDERELTRVTMAAGETQSLTMTTLPLNGSFYPVSLVVHAL